MKWTGPRSARTICVYQWLNKIHPPGLGALQPRRQWARWCYLQRQLTANRPAAQTSCCWVPGEQIHIIANTSGHQDRLYHPLPLLFFVFSVVVCCQVCEESPLYLWVGELQAGDGEDHLPCSDEEILRDLPGHVDGVRADVHHWLDAVSTLPIKKHRQTPQSKRVTFKIYCASKCIHSYIWSKCEIRRDDHGVRAAEAQRLLEDTPLSSAIHDLVLCPERQTAVRAKNILHYDCMWHIYNEKISVLLSLWYRHVFWHVVGDDVPEILVSHRYIHHRSKAIQKPEEGEFSAQ